jgi:hypothetical protein
METLLIKVDTKENQAFLRELLLKFNFVFEVGGKSESVEKSELLTRNVAGVLNAYADMAKVKQEETIWEQVVKSKHGVH